MSKSLIKDVVTLTKEGWRPYNALPAMSVYEKLGCAFVVRGKNPSQPFWFSRGDVFCCVGCGSRCTLTRPNGFPLPLPIQQTYPPEQPYILSPTEMATRLPLLTARQAAYCLNVSDRLIYDYVADGRLVPLKEKPLRVRAEEVRAMMRDFDE